MGTFVEVDAGDLGSVEVLESQALSDAGAQVYTAAEVDVAPLAVGKPAQQGGHTKRSDEFVNQRRLG